MATTTTLVSTASQLLAALNAATGGETILLKSGADFGELQFTNHQFASKVLIQSQDLSNPAHFTDVIFNAVSNLTVDGVAVGGTIKAPFAVTNSDVTFSNITVTNLDAAPTDLVDTNKAVNTVAENAAVGAAVGITAHATDTDVGDRITYTLVDSAGGKFDVASSSGIVTVAAPLDFETATSHNITVKATDAAGLSTTQTFTINVTNVNEAPTNLVDSNTATNTVAENAAVGTTVGIIASATDQDAGDKVTYSLTNSASGKFAINSTTGEVSVAGAIDYETAHTQTITVKATDTAGLSTTQNFTINVTDVNEAPTNLVDSNTTANSVLQTASIGTAVGITAKATDVDAGDKITYSLTENAGGKFAINTTTGVVTVADKMDTQDHTITVKATDTAGLSTTQNFTISTVHINQAPVSMVDSDAHTNSVAENAAVGTAVGITTTATDPDGDALTYTLTDNAGGKFTVDGTTGVVSVAAALDYETAQSHTITVQATDAGGLSTSQTFTVGVTDVNEAPVTLVDANIATNSVAENSAVGTLVGITANATDLDAGDKVTYSLSDNAAGKFAIDTNTGVVSVAGAIDYEAAHSQNITVKATDTTGLSTTQNFTINVTNVNETPTSISDGNTAANNVAENAAVGATVGITAVGVDPDGDKLTYSLTDNAGGKFAINSSTGVVTVASGLDYETATSNNITVKAIDTGGLSTTQNFTINVTNVNEAPTNLVDSNTATNTVAENSAVGTLVGITGHATDPDAGSTLTYSLSDSASGKFAIDASTGVVIVAGPIDYEAAHSQNITIKATDAGGLSTTQTFTIGVTDVNEAPITLVDSDATANSVSQVTAIGSTVGITAHATDPDAGDKITYSLTENAGGKFAIDANTGVVSTADKMDLASHTITVKATDTAGLSTTQNFTIDGVHVNQAPINIVDSNTATNTVAENSAVGTVVGVTATGTDPDGDTLTYSLTDNAGGKFAINATTGVVSVAVAINYESAQTHDITVKTMDAGGLSTTHTFTIGVTNVNETPNSIADSNTVTNSVAENSDIGTLVGITAKATDPDAGDTFTYSLSDSASGKFAIDASTGVVSVAGPIDYEAAHSQNITIKATDAGGLSTTQTFTIGVTDVNEAPNNISDNNTDANTVAENATIGTLVGVTAHAADPDTTDKVIYSLSDNAHGMFAINATTGVISVAGAIDYELSPTQNVTVLATDITGLSTSETFAINVTNVNEAPTGIADINVAANNIHMSAVIGADVGITAHAVDPDADDVMTYSLTDNADGKFAIDANTGVVTVADVLGTSISHDITVKATDSGGFSTLQNFTVSVDTNPIAPAMTLEGSAAEDLLFGNTSGDIINGWQGNDVIVGNGGNDTLQGNQGSDRIYGGEGEDTILGGKDNDQINGNAGADSMNGNIGADTLHGGKDNDLIHGGQGNDQLFGDMGNDTLAGDMGVDYLYGGPGNDVFLFNNAGSTVQAFDTVGDFLSGEDKIDLSAFGYKHVELTTATVNTPHDADTLVLKVEHQADGSTFISNSTIDFGLSLHGTSDVTVTDFLL